MRKAMIPFRFQDCGPSRESAYGMVGEWDLVNFASATSVD
jgi:hypothetical protein